MPMTTTELAMDHTPQESAAIVNAGSTTLKQIEIKVPESSPFGILELIGDNTASCVNINKPGPKPSMVLQAVPLHVAARGLKPKPCILVARYRNKNYMDNETMIDHDPRPHYHLQELGLQPRLVQAAAAALRTPFSFNDDQGRVPLL